MADLNAHQRIVLAVICSRPGGLKITNPSPHVQELAGDGLIIFNTDAQAYFETPAGRRIWLEEPTTFERETQK